MTQIDLTSLASIPLTSESMKTIVEKIVDFHYDKFKSKEDLTLEEKELTLNLIYQVDHDAQQLCIDKIVAYKDCGPFGDFLLKQNITFVSYCLDNTWDKFYSEFKAKKNPK